MADVVEGRSRRVLGSGRRFVIVLAAQLGDRIGAAVPFYGVLKEDYPDLSG